MHFFLICFKRRLFHKQVLCSVLISLLIMMISYAVKASPEIEAFYQVRDGNTPFLAQLSEIYSEEAVARFEHDAQTMAKSHAFSFFMFMENGFTIYHFLANFLITLPVLLFMDDRKNRVMQQMAIKTGRQTIVIQESLSVGLTAFLIVLVPSVLFWGITRAFAPCPFPLNQNFGPAYDSLFQTLGLEQNVAWLYLLLILLVSAGYFFRGLLAFSAALITTKKAVVIFVPIAFQYAAYLVFTVFGWNEYASLSYFDPQIKSFAPMLCSYLLTALAAAVIFAASFGKERFLNE